MFFAALTAARRSYRGMWRTQREFLTSDRIKVSVALGISRNMGNGFTRGGLRLAGHRGKVLNSAFAIRHLKRKNGMPPAAFKLFVVSPIPTFFPNRKIQANFPSPSPASHPNFTSARATSACVNFKLYPRPSTSPFIGPISPILPKHRFPTSAIFAHRYGLRF